MYALGLIDLNKLVKIAFSSIRVSNPIWLPIMNANLGHKCLYYIIKYFETTISAAINRTKQTVSDSWLGLYDK